MKPLEDEELVVEDVVVLLDRGQGGRQNVEMRGKRLHSVMTLPQVMATLVAHGKVDATTNEAVLSFLAANQVTVEKSADGDYSAKQAGAGVPVPKPAEHTYEQRAAVIKNAAGKALLDTIVAKQSNLCVAADVTTSAELLALADQGDQQRSAASS